MLRNLLARLVGDTNEREVGKLKPLVTRINALELEYHALSDDALKAKTAEFKQRIANGESLDELLPEAFAVVKNACRRLVGTKHVVRGHELTWQIIPYDTQLLGGIVLHRGKIAEMKTGEGKTLVCTFPLYLNALAGKGVHLVTVNNYLARRDAEWMSLLFNYLGLTVGVVEHGMDSTARRAAYACDITYGTNTEFGFDYLRDNMARDAADCVQRTLNYAIVDEVDSILIDEARTPLIVSAPAEESTDKYRQYAGLIGKLTRDVDYAIDEKQKTATLTEAGIKKMESLLGLTNIYTEAGFDEVHHIEQSLKAVAVFRRDKDYVVTDGEVVIVDEFTGRLMPGRRWSDGLHQAVEAKEGVDVKRESKTLATITLQNYFRMYGKLAGMTGTALTEAEEFHKIYRLEVVVIPTHRPVARQDLADAVYKTERGKLNAVVAKVKELNAKGQPVLVGTVTIEKSERISDLLKAAGVSHVVLNAKHHEREAEIVAGAGERGAVMIATNMAGRGTDIKLGEGVAELGGLAILGTERHESRRIDNQLRGRAGRQGDPGMSEFYVSMEDSLMRLFGGAKMQSLMDALNVPEDMPIQNGMISNSIESAQKKVEAHNFEMRKHVVEYDDVMNKHREIIYSRRRKILEHADIATEIQKLLAEEADAVIDVETAGLPPAEWDVEKIAAALRRVCDNVGEPLTSVRIAQFDNVNELKTFAVEYFKSAYAARFAHLPEAAPLRHAERQVYLSTIDKLWMEHLENMTYLREKVSLRGYGQRDPLIEYKGEAYELFATLLGNIRATTVGTLCHLNITLTPHTPAATARLTPVMPTKLTTNENEIVEAMAKEFTPEAQKELAAAAKAVLTPNQQLAGLGKAGEATIRADDMSEVEVAKASNPTVIRVESNDTPTIGRNDPCPCGSGKKYKKCCGAGGED